MAKPKPGRVIRIDELTFRFISEKRRRGEQITALLRRLLGLPSRKDGSVDRPVRYALSSDLYETMEDARGASVLRSVKQKEKKIEEPIPVREVS